MVSCAYRLIEGMTIHVGVLSGPATLPGFKSSNNF